MSLIKAVLARLRGKAAAGSNVFVFPDDVFLVSFPRSGNTWTRFLLGNLIHPDAPMTFASIEQKVPDIYINSQESMLRVPRPRILKSHEPFDPRYRRVIYIVRDPRDVAVSSYHYKIKRRVINESYGLDRFVPRFITGEFNGTAGSWGENVVSWLAARRNTPQFLLLRYEDMLRDPIAELRKVVCFLELSAGREVLARAVELSSVERMQNLEREQGQTWKRTRNDVQSKPFVRSAKAGSWCSELSAASVAVIEQAWGSLMGVLGYELAGSKATRLTNTTDSFADPSVSEFVRMP